jgi:hypothetical protein
MKLRTGIGVSQAQDATEAGHAAAAAALAGLSGEPPALIMVFCTPRYDLPKLLAAIRAVTGTTLLIGATSSGEIVQGACMGFGAGVAVLALTAGPYRFAAASASHIRIDMDRAAQNITRACRDEAGASPYAGVLVLADALLGDLQQVVQGVYRITGPKVPMFGGAASDEQQFVETSIFHNDTIVREGALALWIASERPLRVEVQHGWQPIGVPLLITRAEGAEIFEIGGRPASVVYEEQLGLEPGTLSADQFWDTSINHPFGLLQADGSFVIRVARAKTAQGGLRIQGCAPSAGSAVQVMRGTPDMLLDIVESTAAGALEGHPEANVLLACSCAARATIFGDRKPEEAHRLQAAAGPVPVFGMHCCGEFSRTSGVLGTHNATLTAMAL